MLLCGLQAMLKYEPQALKALITCTMAPPT